MNAPRHGVRVELLGTFGVAFGQEVIDCAWPSRRSAELVQLLALADGHRMSVPVGQRSPDELRTSRLVR